MKNIAKACRIVADDYGMSVEINHAISELIKKKIVSKVSVMANESLEYSMSDIGERAEAGLHINFMSDAGLTETNQDKKKSFLNLLYLIYSGKLNINRVIDNIEKQFKVLESKGFKVCCLDTHQHMHVIPELLKALIAFAKANAIKSIRCITIEKRYLFFYFYSLMRFGFFTQVPKMIFLYAMGKLMKLQLDKAQINYCRNLFLMPLAGRGNYQGLLEEFLDKFEDKDAEIVVHPGLEAGTSACDDYTGRHIEYISILKQEGKYGKEDK